MQFSYPAIILESPECSGEFLFLKYSSRARKNPVVIESPHGGLMEGEALEKNRIVPSRAHPKVIVRLWKPLGE